MNQITLQSKLKESFSSHKDYTAIEYGDHVLTYGELGKKSNRVANWLIKRETKKESFIGILMDCRRDLIIVMLGVLKAGCVVVPLDTTYPDKRLKEMIQSTGIELIIGDRANINRLVARETQKKQEQDVEFIEVNAVNAGQEEPDGCVQYSPGDRIYIYFTSGTTGKPGAIVGKNKSLLHFINWEIDTFGIEKTFRFSQFINPGFDAFLRDIFVPLYTGGTICIPDNNEIIIDSDQMIQWIDIKRISLIHCVPSLFRLFNTNALRPGLFRSLKYVFLSGEKIIPKELINWYNTLGEQIQLVNLYGPTETTLIKLFYLIREVDTTKEIMPIGKPMIGSRVIILNENMKGCKPLETGEIYIRTPYRTYGYYNDPESNTAKFIPNPFNNDPDDLIFKTGDLGRFLTDGNIELLGRIDRQVKVRGMRVELDEVENTLLQYPSIKEAVVVKREVREKNEFLAALITREEGNGQDGEDDDQVILNLKKFTAEKLPDYMVPNHITIIKQIPRKPNGKVDYKEISGIANQFHMDYIAPGTLVEKKLVEFWVDLLGFENIGITNSFFELGGNSLVVMNLITRIHKEFDVKILPRDIFKNNTIKAQAKIITAAVRTKHYSIEAVEKKEYYPLSSAQKRLFVLNMIEGNTATNYNMPRAFRLEGNLDKLQVEEKFRELIRHHEALRTSFQLLKETPVQFIHDSHHVPFRLGYGECGEDSIQKRIPQFIKPFDLSKAPLLRAELFKISADKNVLAVDIHHIIADDSFVLLLHELMALYRGEQLKPLRIHYKDYAEWQNKLVESGIIKKQEQYWLQVFDSDIPVLNLPTDYPRPRSRSTRGDIIFFSITNQLAGKMRHLARGTETTLYMISSAVFNILLSKYSHQEDIIIGTPVTGKNHEDLQNIIGTFANMVAMRNYPQKHKTFNEFLMEVKKNALEAFENQDYQFEDLLTAIGLHTPPGRNPLFDAVLNLGRAYDMKQYEDHEKKADEKIAISSQNYEYNASKYDLLLRALESVNGLEMSLEYSTTLFKPSSAQRIIGHYIEILEQVLENKDIKLKEITISYEVAMLEHGSKENDVAFNF